MQVSHLPEWTGHLQKAVQYMALCVRLPSPPAPTSPSSQNLVNLIAPDASQTHTHPDTRAVSLMLMTYPLTSELTVHLESIIPVEVPLLLKKTNCTSFEVK